MKKVLVIIAASLLALVTGIAGSYFLMPIIDPDRVEYVRQARQALLEEEDTGDGDAYPQITDLWVLRTLEDVDGDSLQVLQEAALFRRGLSLDSLENLFVAGQTAKILKDSIRVISDSIRTLVNGNAQLARELDQLHVQYAALGDKVESAGELSATLTRLDERELRSILAEVEPAVYDRLYTETPENRRGALLRALPPEHAARLVERIIIPGFQPPARPRNGEERTIQTSLADTEE